MTPAPALPPAVARRTPDAWEMRRDVAMELAREAVQTADRFGLDYYVSQARFANRAARIARRCLEPEAG